MRKFTLSFGAALQQFARCGRRGARKRHGIRIRLSRLLLACLVVTGISAGSTLRADEPAVTDAQVRDAMEGMKRFLYASRDANGGWDETYSHTHAYPGAMTALVTTALLLAGESPQQPELAHAIKLMRGAEPVGTYQVALRAHVWAQLPDEYRGLLSSDVRWLAAAAYADGSYGYTPPADSSERQANSHWYDNSNTQYGNLGLWEGAKRGIHVGNRFWAQTIDFWLNAQYEDGGWAYRGPGSTSAFANQRSSYASMTCAGLTALYIAQEQMYARRMNPDPRLTAAIDRGLAWMDQRFDGSRNINGNSTDHRYYYIYSVERVALASGRRFFNDQPWFERIAAEIVARQLDSGAVRPSRQQAVKDTAFALMFLARGHVPVWVTKLELDDGASGPQPTNNRPNDLTFPTRFLSDLYQTEVNWQRLPLHMPVDRWGACPVAYLASDEPVTLDDRELANLRRFLDLGGLLVANPDAESSRFVKSMRQLGERLYPGRSFERLPADHPLYGGHLTVAQPGRLVIETLNNGVRDVIYLSHADLAYEWQATSPDVEKAAWQVAANLFAHATERGDLLNRLTPAMPPASPIDDPPSRLLGIVRPRYDGLWCPEPLAWEAVRRELEQGGRKHDDRDADAGFEPLRLVTSPSIPANAVALAALGSAPIGLVHLAGVEPIVLTSVEVDAIKNYVDRGGTILVETVGGRGDFALSLERQLAPRFGGAAMPLDADHPLLTGEGISGTNVTRAVYRPFTVLRLNPGGDPRLLAFHDAGRPTVIFSSEDLSLGMLGVRRWGILGYAPDYARRVMTNLALWCAHEKAPARVQP